MIMERSEGQFDDTLIFGAPHSMGKSSVRSLSFYTNEYCKKRKKDVHVVYLNFYFILNSDFISY